MVRTRAGSRKPNFGFIGNNLCLDFMNTADWHASKEPVELLAAYRDLLTWGEKAGAISRAESRALAKEAAARPADAERARVMATTLREAMYRVLTALIEARQPDPADLGALNAALAKAMARARVESKDGGFAWGWEPDPKALDRVIWPVIRSAAELLASDRLTRLRRCENAGCGWLFLDTSRNHRRRWCSMESCGNQTKARRFYERKKAIEAGKGRPAPGAPAAPGSFGRTAPRGYRIIWREAKPKPKP